MFLTLSLQTKLQFNAIPHVSPIVLLSFHRFLTTVFDGAYRPHFFHNDPAKSQETLKLVPDWALLSNAEKCNFQPFSICFYVFFPIVLYMFHCFFRNCWGTLRYLFGFVLTWPCKKSGNFEIGETYNPKPFSICFAVFSHCFVQISLFFRKFYLLASFSPLSLWPAKSQETSKLVVDWALLSTAEKCNPQPFCIGFAEVFIVFVKVFDGFGNLLQSFPLFFKLKLSKNTAFQ